MKHNGKHLDARGFDATQTLKLMPPVKGMNNLIPVDFLQEHQARNIENCEYSLLTNTFTHSYKLQRRTLFIGDISHNDIKKVYNFQTDLQDEVIAFARKGTTAYIVDVLNEKIIATIENSKSDDNIIVKWDENFMVANGSELYEVYRDGHTELRNMFIGKNDSWSVSKYEAPATATSVYSCENTFTYNNKIFYTNNFFIESFDARTGETKQYGNDGTGLIIHWVVKGNGSKAYFGRGGKIYELDLYTGSVSTEKINVWTFATGLAYPSYHPVFYNDCIYLFGVHWYSYQGDDNDFYQAFSKDCYKVNVNSWTSTVFGQLPTKYKRYGSTALLDGKAYLIGGRESEVSLLINDQVEPLSDEVITYDFSTNRFNVETQKLAYKGYCIGVTVYENFIYYMGGRVGITGEDRNNYLYTYPDNAKLELADPPLLNKYTAGSVFPVLARVDNTLYYFKLLGTYLNQVFEWTMAKEVTSVKCLLIKDGRVVISQDDILYYSGVGDSTLWNFKDTDSDDGGLFLQVGYKENSHIIHAIIAAGNIVCWKDNGYIYVVKGSYPDWQIVRLAENELLTTNTVSIGGEVIYGTETGLKKLSTTSAYGDYVVSKFQNSVYDLKARYLHVSKSRNSLLVCTDENMYEFNIDLQSWYNIGNDKGNLSSFITYRHSFFGNVILGIRSEVLDKGMYSTPYQSSSVSDNNYLEDFTISYSRELSADRILIKEIIIYCDCGKDLYYRMLHPIKMFSHGKGSRSYKRKELRFTLENRFKETDNTYKVIKHQIMTVEAFQPEFVVPCGINIHRIEIKYVVIGIN